MQPKTRCSRVRCCKVSASIPKPENAWWLHTAVRWVRCRTCSSGFARRLMGQGGLKHNCKDMIDSFLANCSLALSFRMKDRVADLAR